MKCAQHVADRIAFLHEGQIYYIGSFEGMAASPDPLIQDFIHGRSGERD
jgi:ABC-type transporter Mla maintaining outer membrane lipid asymmetry ATPase subunit MlaF